MVAKHSAATTLTTPSDREIVITRVVDAPRRLVFAAYTNPEHVARWYGPSTMTLVVCDIDLRPGGAWRFILRGPDGTATPSQACIRRSCRPSGCFEPMASRGCRATKRS